ncbi:MAG: flagellar biosynthesis anti-sigma factor FlgM [Nitrospirae bacterium]|nr:flagellar biosynthesis anti-sigma factor FlgM [Nitrospirota bacterium]
MNIQGNNPIDGKDLYNKVQDLNKNQEPVKKDNVEKADIDQDKISLSGKAMEIRELKDLIEQLPDIRKDKVEQIKKAVDAGNYNIDSLKVAERILEEI